MQRFTNDVNFTLESPFSPKENTSFLSTTHFGIKVNHNQVNKSEVLKALNQGSEKLKIEFKKFHVPNHFIKQNIEANHTNTET